MNQKIRIPLTDEDLEDLRHGKTFDWNAIPQNLDKPIILAGGLNPENVAEAIKVVQPYAVDVSSGVERDKGLKDAEKVTAFIHEVKYVG